MKRALFTFILLACLAPYSRADFNDGVVAYLTGRYEEAYATMRSLAETADHGYAQYYVAMMHLNGQGVQQDYEEAAKWFRKAAEHGIPQAQYKLGSLYLNGQGMPRDYEQAYAWYLTGAAHQHKQSVAALEGVRERLSPEELKEAEKLSQKLVRAYGPQNEPDQPVEIQPE